MNGVRVINGRPVRRERVEDVASAEAFGQPMKGPQYVETLPDGASYRIVERDGNQGYWDNTNVYTVPEGHVFTLGDNRDNSTDSRDLSNVGYVPIDNIVGRAFMRFFSVQADEAGARNPENGGSVRWDRLFNMVH